jgi:DNA replication protein DnaC
MNCELTKECPFCGQRLLTLAGAVVLDDHVDPRREALLGLEMACTCSAAKYADEQIDAELEASRRSRAAKLREDKLKARLEASNMPTEWHERGLSKWLRRTPNEQAAYDAAVAFGRRIKTGEHPSLYIAGAIGTGKTMLASCLSLDLVRLGYTVLWSNVGDVLRSLRATFNGKDNEEAVIARYTSPPILVLDDLGKERPTEWAAEQLFAILNRRYERNKTTIVTTNYGGADLVKRLTPRPDSNGYADDTTAAAIVDRLRGTANLLILEGDSKR